MHQCNRIQGDTNRHLMQYNARRSKRIWRAATVSSNLCNAIEYRANTVKWYTGFNTMPKPEEQPLFQVDHHCNSAPDQTRPPGTSNSGRTMQSSPNLGLLHRKAWFANLSVHFLQMYIASDTDLNAGFTTNCGNCTLMWFLATLVALHFTPVSKWLSD